MCTYFTDLNKCCRKDDFPLARIDKIVHSAAASEMLALLDCFLGIVRSGFTQKMRKKLVSSLCSELTATSEC
jgi:hypothetical protein